MTVPDGIDAPLFKTQSGGRLHIPMCPHVLGVPLVVPSTTHERGSLQLCTWCLAELSGQGRTPHETIEEALEDLAAPQGNRAELARLLREAPHDAVYVPFSRSYVAVTADGKGFAWAGKTYVAYDDGRQVTLDGYVEGGGGGPDINDAWGELCETCFTSRSVTGTCNCNG